MASGMMRDLFHSARFLVMALFAVGANAEELLDPTRPPISIAAPVSVGGAEVAPPPAGLQSIIISKVRRAAIINGETVELGGKHGDAKLIEVNEGSVVLRGAQGRQVMTLFPDVKITGKQEAGKAARKERK
jgi:MSHA biogenesis protein MshK